MCDCVSYPITAINTHMHQAALEGVCDTLVRTTCWQCEHLTKPGMFVRHVTLMGTGGGWVTTTGTADGVCLLLTGCIPPTGVQRKQEGQRKE